jgi:hypothetical protein
VKKQQWDVKYKARKKEDQKTKWWWCSIHREHDEWFKFHIADEWADRLHDVWFDK